MLSRRQFWGLVALTLMWGVNWPMMKLSLRELTPLYFRAFTMTGGALWLYLFFRARGVRMAPAGPEWRQIAALALPNMLGWHVLSIFGVQALASGRAAILGFTMPVWTVLLGALFFGERLTRRVGVAAALVLLAIGLLLSHELDALAGRPVGVLWMEGAALAWALGTLMMRRARLTLPMPALTVWMMILTAAVLWVLALVAEPWPEWRFSWPMWLSLAYGVLINYGFAQIIWFGLARHLPPATSAMSIMAVPLIGTLSATLIVGEWPTWQDGVAMLAVMGAMAAVLLSPRTPRTAPVEDAR
ncbi:threonine/homoserine efflux transporter RhtA [Tibeticola sediminis]|uniref:Threonine/homoserine efflux transporter RhtA n=1 Tax=Tibeticola sediminis TaxID=1917811 RepID=A0A3N4UTA1_9BURK|nr:DMT family transporter [Tibeticola sediminis]RPE64910.1 threonine/homoserine efflux transporter RhtA [Tibeticola sediminis]